MMAKLKSGDISQAEYNFFDETSKMMEEFAPYVVGDRRRKGYIPHVKPSLMEMYSRKGFVQLCLNPALVSQGRISYGSDSVSSIRTLFNTM